MVDRGVSHLPVTAGSVAVLQPHEQADWFAEGTTSDGRQCDARSVSTGERCPKESAVALATARSNVLLCGGHYGVHRRGKPVTLVIEWPV